jgi:hypothetical protein
MSQNKTNKLKELVLKQLEKTPIIETTCQICGVHRSTFYRWKADDLDFAEKADNALIESRELISDLAESQLISHIKDKNLRAIIFWLKNNSKYYAPKLQVQGSIKTETKLSDEDTELIKKALENLNLINEE